ncbi:MAG: YHS domain-containing protein [Chthonomonadaceae bacterium]|nr:YHS domain-containing protein [Chthonomonadaceae bacterium]
MNAPAVDAPVAKPDDGMQNASVVDYTNDKGEIVCPVMGTVIKDKTKAVGYQDVDGKRYYFCCDGCPEDFKADPQKYIAKK